MLRRKVGDVFAWVHISKLYLHFVEIHEILNTLRICRLCR